MGRDAHATVGVLIVSMPALNGPWRERAWPGVFDSRDLARLNAEVRVVSRVIVDPRYRGLGVGRSLVRAYLDAPLSPRTEAIAVMGRWSGLFTGTGMRAVEYPAARRVRRLSGVLRGIGVRPWELADPDQLLTRLARRERAAMVHALRVFAGAHRDTRAEKDRDVRTLIVTAARRVATRPVAYVTERGEVKCG